MLTVFVVLLLTLVALVYYFIRKQFTFFVRHPFPHEKPSLFKGNMTFKSHIAEEFKTVYDKFKSKTPAFGFHYMLMPAVVITDLDVIEDILVTNGDYFSIRAYFYDKENDPLAAQLVSLKESEWSVLRENFTPFFSGHKMKMIFRTLLNMSDHAISQTKTGKSSETIEARQWFSKYASDVIGNIVFGIDMNALDNPNSKFCELGFMLFDMKFSLMLKIMFIQFFNTLSRKCRVNLYPIEVTKFFLGIVSTIVKYRIRNKITRSDILDMLLGIKDKDGAKQKLSIKEIGAQCFVFFLFGFETVSCTGAFALYELATNVEVQEKLRDEIKMILARYDDKITYEAINEMKYLQMVVDGE
jgi:cytochrome P450 family 6